MLLAPNYLGWESHTHITQSVTPRETWPTESNIIDGAKARQQKNDRISRFPCNCVSGKAIPMNNDNRSLLITVIVNYNC
jgi:hypothetical protein